MVWQGLNDNTFVDGSYIKGDLDNGIKSYWQCGKIDIIGYK